MSEIFCYVNGQLLPSSKASVSVFDHGFTVADGVFETLKFKAGVPFALNRHIRRLASSCAGLGIAAPSTETIQNAVAEVAKANSHVVDGRMRITVTSGSGPLGSDRINVEPTLVISVAPQKPWSPTSEVLLVPWIRNEKSPLVGLKTTSYAENVFALEAAHTHGFSESIFLNSTGLLSEGTGSNIFIVKTGEILTPGTNSGLLQGITRELVLEWAAETFTISEKDLTAQDLWDADEVFITSSTRDVHPVSRLAQLSTNGLISSEKQFQVGPITSEIVQLFNRMSSELINP